MTTGAKIAIGCGCVVLLGAAAVIGALGVGAWWAKGKIEQASDGLDKMTAASEEIERFEKQANANPYTAPADGTIPEARFLKFMDVRKQVYAVYERHETVLRDLQKTAESPTDKLTFSQLWSAGGTLAEVAGAIRLAQMKALAASGMSEAEYRDIQMAVYQSAWASEAGGASPGVNAELFRRHQAEINQYAMHGLAFLGF